MVAEAAEVFLIARLLQYETLGALSLYVEVSYDLVLFFRKEVQTCPSMPELDTIYQVRSLSVCIHSVHSYLRSQRSWWILLRGSLFGRAFREGY